MSGLSVRDNEELRRLLQDAVVKCSERCLYQSAKWAAELLNSFPPSELVSPADTEIASPIDDSARWDRPAYPIVVSQNSSPKEAKLEADEAHKYLLAKTYFDCREYDRCAGVFLPMTLPKGDITSPSTRQGGAFSQNMSGQSKDKAKARISPEKRIPSVGDLMSLSQRSLFLALYAKFMSGEKRKDEESEMILGPSDGGSTVNKEIVGICRTLESWAEREEQGDGWLEYLYGLVLAKGKNEDQAKKWLLKSVHIYPFNWGAWQELGSLLSTTDDLQALVPQLPQNIISFIFHIYANQELFQAQDQILSDLRRIKALFPTSTFLRTQKALLYYHAKDFEKAEHIFSKIVQSDPLRIDDLDTYSNILYVMEKLPKLAFLAQLATATDRFRPETCCVVGNYYAKKSEHEKAVMYFKRALILDRNFLSAWTLMGHEFIEMKNTQAAIECYRRAVDVNRKDYRAWYGLGQTYEVLEMHFYALFYYQRAAALSPYDPKMWSAVGSCLAKMKRFDQAIKAYKRALVAGSYYEGSSSSFGSNGQRSHKEVHQIMDPEVLYGIACMYDRLGNEDETKAYLELTLAQEEGPEADEEESMFKASTSSFTSGSAAQERGRVQGVGVTATTSKARMWLATLEAAVGTRTSLVRAMQLANELCQDGYEVEEAKSLVKDVRSRMIKQYGELV